MIRTAGPVTRFAPPDEPLAHAAAEPSPRGRWPRAHRDAAAWVPGESPEVRELCDQLARAAAADPMPVLLVGERGTGKGRLARRIHQQGPRAGRPLVEVNCAAYAGDGLEAALFGGASGGLLALARGGTLFLDEIAEVPPRLQTRLLDVLGAPSPEVRIVAATRRDLVNAVTDGAFREDLYYRLGVMSLQLPPLRARARGDLVALVEDVMDELATELPEAPRALAPSVVDRLVRRAWPGNVRELRNAIERALLEARGGAEVRTEHLPLELRERLRDVNHEPRTLAAVEREHIERTLQAHRGNRTHAARELGISRATLIKKVREYGLGTARTYRVEEEA